MFFRQEIVEELEKLKANGKDGLSNYQTATTNFMDKLTQEQKQTVDRLVEGLNSGDLPWLCRPNTEYVRRT